MKQPIIFSIDDDPQVLRALQRDLRSRFKKEYKVLSTTSANEALEALEDLKKQSQEVALFISDQRMPEMLGVDFLDRAKQLYPNAKSVLLTAYSDIDAAVKAINSVQLDYYLHKPWDPPEEKLYPILIELLEDWQMGYRPDFDGLRLVGYQFSPQSHQLKDILAGNLFPYQWLDYNTQEKAKEVVALHNLTEADLPIVIFEDGNTLIKPSRAQLREKLGNTLQATQEVYDVVIIGAGPAGLAAAVYGGSEGLKTLLIEKRAPGGQAGTSSKIENYLGFPKGLSGSELTRRAITQARRFGVEFLAPQEVVDIKLRESYKIITLGDESEIVTKSIVVATGVEYRQLNNTGMEALTGAGVYYGAATTEANACLEKQVYVVGGGNSAGQGAMYLSRFASRVFIIIRKPDLSLTMSQYLIDQINDTPNIQVLGEMEVIEAIGEQQLERVVLKNRKTEETTACPASALFIFIGTKPRTDWIALDIIRNDKGFIETGRNLLQYESFNKIWKLDRDPYLLETCIPGLFAAGDVRAGAMNRVASAVGEGSMAISLVHKYLDEV
ncbi:MAG: FAD-dependent oxidoreductase [Thermonemataceae bacterium]